jgi:uncharacterized membrane protein YqhA
MADEGERSTGWPAAPQRESSWSYRFFASSRFFAGFAVFGSFLAAITLYVYGTFVVIQEILDTLNKNHLGVPGMQRLQAAFIEMTDVFLLGTVLFIVSFGLFQLFIQPDLPVPAWLKIENLDQLSERLIEVVGVLLAVTFLGFAVNLVADVVETAEEGGEAASAVATGTSPVSLLELGISVAIVIVALSLLLFVSRRHAASHGAAQDE